MAFYSNDNGSIYQDPSPSTDQTDVSFFGWVKVADLTQDTYIFANHHSGGFGQGWALILDDNGSGSELKIDVAFVASLSSTLTITDTDWHFVGLQRRASDGEWIVFLDDEREEVGSSSPFGIGEDSIMAVGARNVNGSLSYIGEAYWCQVGYWEQLLSDADILDLRCRISDPADITTSLVAALDFPSGDLVNNPGSAGDFTAGGTTTYDSDEAPDSVGFVGSSTGGATSGTAVSASLPSGTQADDVAIAVVHANGPQDVSDNNGADPYTSQLSNREYNGPSAQFDLWYRVLDGTEGSTVDFTLDGSNRWSIVVSVYRNVDTSTLWDVEPTSTTENTGSGSSNSTDAITTGTDGSKIITFAGNNSNTVTFTGTPSGFVARENNSGEQLIGLADKSLYSAGSQASVTWTQSTSNGTWLNNIFALVPNSSAIADLTINKTESVTVTETVSTPLITSFINVLDSVSIAESITAATDALTLAVADAVTVGESVTVSTAFEINVSDSTSISESVSLALDDIAITVNDEVSIAETVAQVVESFISTSDAVSVGESTNLTVSMTINVNEDITVSESLSQATGTLVISVLDGVTIGEDLDVNATTGFDISVSESVSVGEAVTVEIPIEIVAVEVVLVEEEITTAGDLGDISVSESVTVAESSNVAQTYNLSVEDDVSIAEAVNRTFKERNIIKGSKDYEVIFKVRKNQEGKFISRRLKDGD